MERKENRKEIRKVGKKTGKFLENLSKTTKKMYNQMDVFQKMGVWVWMAGEGMTRGVHRAFACIPTTCMVLSVVLLTSCRSHVQSATTDYQIHRYQVSKLVSDSIIEVGSQFSTIKEHFDISIWLPEDTLKPSKRITIDHTSTKEDTTTTEISHSNALQSKIDSSSYTCTTKEKKVQHTQNLIRWQDWCFAIILAALILLIYVKKR